MSDSVTVTLMLSLKPEAIEPFCTNMPTMLEQTRQFPGFRDIKVLRHADRPESVILIEEWDSREAYEAYVAFRTETGVMDELQQTVTAPPQLEYWSGRIA